MQRNIVEMGKLRFGKIVMMIIQRITMDVMRTVSLNKDGVVKGLNAMKFMEMGLNLKGKNVMMEILKMMMDVVQMEK